MRYDPIMCMMVPDSVKTHDELSLSQKKQVVTELKGYLKKTYNFSDESEYARAYEDLRHMFATGSRKSISGLFENAVKKTGAHDSVETKDADPIAALSNFKKTAEYGDSIKIDIGKGKTAIVQKEANGWYATIGNEKVKGTFNVIAGYLKSASAKDSVSAIDKAIRSCDEQIRLVKTISKKNGYAIHIVESGYGEQIVLTFPNESYADPHMWLGPNNSSNIQRAKSLLDAFSK